ncbi:hypothetical protein KUV57_12045 [Epibacterium sp. DP7N7-1]|nr:hypothetical protein [Epibacterium sp. DP7N7-1]
MSNLLSALNKTARKNTPRTLNGSANMVGEVLAYDEKTIKVKVLSGPIAGQEIDIDPGNKTVKDFEKVSKAQTSSYTPVGGILRFDGVSRNNDGTYKSRWTNAWIKNPGDEHKLMTDQLVSYKNTGRKNSDGAPITNIQVMDAKNEKTVSDFDEMKSVLVDGFTNSGAVLVIDTGEGFSSATYYLPGERKGDEYVRKDPNEFAQELIDDIQGDAELSKLFGERMNAGHLTIVPVQRITVGPKSAEEAQNAIDKAEEAGNKARIMTVNPYAYDAPSVGVRLVGALARKDREQNLEIAEEYADRLKASFLASAPQGARDAFMADGWIGVSDADLKDFFEANGVALMKAPSQTWNTASIHLQQFGGSENFFAAKTHESYRYGTPFPPLECAKEIRAAYATELHDAIMTVVKSPEAAADAKTDAPAAKDEAPKADPEAEKKAAEISAEQEADIDGMLDAIADQPMA